MKNFPTVGSAKIYVTFATKVCYFFVKYNIDNYLTKSYNDTTKFVKKISNIKKPIKLIKKLEVSQDGKERRTGKSSGNH